MPSSPPSVVSASKQKTRYAFDIDGVLVDTRDAVREAYRRAGVEQPHSAWGQPWIDWLPQLTDDPQDARREKSRHYVELIKEGALKILPMGHFAQLLEYTGQEIAYVTSSSNPSASLILKMMGLDHTMLLGTELQPAERAQSLREWATTGIYIDDRAEAVDIARDAGWSFMHANTTWES